MKAHIITGLGFGDEGKGTMVDYLCRRNNATLVVRYNGGDQAGHNVHLPNRTRHTFSQIGAGAFIPGVKTLISKYMLWNPISLANEMNTFKNKCGMSISDRHYISEDASVITPFHVAANRIIEYCRDSRHGSCGRGVGLAAMNVANNHHFVITAKDIMNCENKLASTQSFYRGYCSNELESLDKSNLSPIMQQMVDLLTDGEKPKLVQAFYRYLTPRFNIMSEFFCKHLITLHDSVFEGAQGVLLDEDWGFHPHTTWSHCTPKNALSLLNEACFDGEVETTGVIRTYMTRHGAGPFPTESNQFDAIKTVDDNCFNEWQEGFRAGFADMVLLDYAIEACKRDNAPIDNIALTHTDVAPKPIVDSYVVVGGDTLGKIMIPKHPGQLNQLERIGLQLSRANPLAHGYWANIRQAVEETSKVKIAYRSFGRTYREKEDVTI